MMATQNNWNSYEFRDEVTGVILRSRINRLASSSSDEAPVVILITGDGPKGSKSMSWANLPPRLEMVGIRSFLFDFAGLGYSDGTRRSLTCDAGSSNLRSAYRFLRSTICGDDVRMGAVASSFGANILLCSPDIANELHAIVLKSPAGYLPEAYANEVGRDEFRRWARIGYSEVNGYDFQVFRSALAANAYLAASRINSPCLITHGTADEIVPFAQSVVLSGLLGGDVEFVPFEDGGHGYSEEGAWERMASMYVEWLHRRLRIDV